MNKYSWGVYLVTYQLILKNGNRPNIFLLKRNQWISKKKILSLYSSLIFKFMGIIATLIIGAIAGWLGGTIYKGSGLGLIGNIIVGILGSNEEQPS